MDKDVGKQVVSMFNINSPSAMSVSVGFMSYIDDMRFCVAVDESVVSDPTELMRCIESETVLALRNYGKSSR